MSRITPGVMTVVVFALLAGLAGAYVVRHHLTPQPTLPPQQVAIEDVLPETVIVPVALTDLKENRTVNLNDIALMRMTREEFEKSQYASDVYLSNSTQIEGRRLRVSVQKGDTFSPEKLYPFGSGPGVLDRLQAGYRGVTIPVQNIGAVQGFAEPGSFVDVLFRSTPDSDQKRIQEVTLTLFERVEVLALDSDVVDTKRGDVGSVTLAVTPQQAKILKVVEGKGQLSLTLRHPDDDFEFAPFDPALERSLSELAEDGIALPASYPAAAAATAANKASSSKAEADRIEGVDGVIGNASERLTLADLLGLSPLPQENRMEVFKGGQREVLTFEEPENDSPELLQRGGRIRTPIVDSPTRRPRPLGTAAVGN